MPNLKHSSEYAEMVEDYLNDAHGNIGRQLKYAIPFYLVSAIVYALLAIAASIEEK